MSSPDAGSTRLQDAIRFALDKHAHQFRKGTDRPYILHPLEVMLLLSAMNADTDLLMAGVLHDTVEDTDATLPELEARFGPGVAGLVGAHTDDKSLPWQERKAKAVAELARADRRVQMLVLADKVSNLRSMARDHAQVGEALWDRFHAPKEQQSWYYSVSQDALQPMVDDPDAREVYWEMTALYKDLFVSYGLDTTGEVLYQYAAHGEAYRLHREHPYWEACPVPECLLAPVSRAAAETLEDLWRL